MATAKKTNKKPEDQKINFKDRVTVYATGIGSHHKIGDEIRVHPVQAAALVASGKASEKPTKTE